jgi:hypothetical protein
MKRIIFIWIAFVSTGAFAQNYIAPKPNEFQEVEAEELAGELDNQLSFTENQLLKVEFIARRDQIVGSQEISILEKNEFLEAIYVEQGNEMADILSRLQMNRYASIRGDLQPLYVLR